MNFAPSPVQFGTIKVTLVRPKNDYFQDINIDSDYNGTLEIQEAVKCLRQHPSALYAPEIIPAEQASKYKGLKPYKIGRDFSFIKTDHGFFRCWLGDAGGYAKYTAKDCETIATYLKANGFDVEA